MHLFISKDYHFKNQLEKFIKMIKIILEDLFWKDYLYGEWPAPFGSRNVKIAHVLDFSNFEEYWMYL